MLEQLEAARARARMLEDQAEATAQEAVEAKAQIIAAANAAIDEIIRASGLTYGEILGEPLAGFAAMTTSKPAKKRGGGEHPRYAIVGDPSRTYSRGPVPGWLKQAMEEAGLDASDKGGRETFRAKYMEQVA